MNTVTVASALARTDPASFTTDGNGNTYQTSPSGAIVPINSGTSRKFTSVLVTALTDQVLPNDCLILVDATATPCTEILCQTPIDGKQYTIKKIDTSGNLVTVSGGAISVDGILTIGTQNATISVIYSAFTGTYNRV